MKHALFSITLMLAFCGNVGADVDVNLRQDTIVLNDGTEIQCLILMSSPTGVAIVICDAKDPEKRVQRTVARSTIRSITIGERSGRTEGLLTDVALANKVVMRAGTRAGDDSLDKKGAGKSSSESGIASNDRPKSASKSKKSGSSPSATATAGDRPDDTAKTVADKQDKKPAEPKNVVPETAVALPPPALPAKELTDAYVARFPDLQSAALDIAGAQRIQVWLDSARDGNGAGRRPLENLLTAYMGSAETNALATSVRNPLPAKSGRSGKSVKPLSGKPLLDPEQ